MSQSDEESERKRPQSASGDGAPSSKAATPASTWIILTVALTIALGMAYSVISLRRQAGELRLALLNVSRLSEQSSRVHALAWEAIASKGELSTLHDDARVAAELRRETLMELRRDGAIPDLSRIEIAVNEHQAVIDEEFEHLAADRIDQARVLGGTRAKLALERVLGIESRMRFVYRRVAADKARTADLESVLMVVLGAATVVLVYRRFTWAQRSGELQAARERAQSEARFRTLVQNASDVITVIDAQGAISYQSPSLLRVLGFSPDELLGKSLSALVHPDDLDAAAAFDTDLVTERAARRVQCRFRHADGSYRFVDNICTNLFDNPEMAGIVVNTRDVTEEKVAERALRDSEEMLRAREEHLRFLIGHVPVVVYRAEIGAEGRWLYVSPQIETLLGFTPQEWEADPRLWLQRVHPDDRDACVDEEEEVLHSVDDKPGATEYRLITRDGRTIWVIDDAVVVRDSDGAPDYWSGVLYDITDRKLLEQQLEQQALSDSLTGLANRVLFLDRVEHALARGQRDEEPVTVMFLDLDDFKTVNDSLGHEAGDQLLITVGARLHSYLRPADTIARLGGDEFAILLESTSAEAAIPMARRVLQTVGEPYSLEGRAIVVRASIGIETGTAFTHSAGELLRNADVAMYVAKGAGKDRVAAFDPGMHTAALKRLEMKADLQRAITEQELVLYYQPIVALVDGAVLGVEALVRWRHPQNGMITPADFIPVAEDSGLIIPLGKWVLTDACRQAAQWQTENPRSPSLGMSVNVSTAQLFHANFIEEVAAALEASGLDPHSLTLEITESGLMEDKEAAISKLKELRQLGVRVAVDDFGTGYSSLGYLSTLPIDVLKIDKMFIDGVARGPEESAIAGAVGKVANALGLVLVAEGIEFEEQVEALIAMEFERGQGYYYSRAVPASEILSLTGF